MRRRPPRSPPTDTRLPYTTLFRSRPCQASELHIRRQGDDGIGGRYARLGPARQWRAPRRTVVQISSTARHLGRRLRRAERARRHPARRRPLHAEPAGDAARTVGKHTSELQSLMRISYAVLCLKKKKKTNKRNLCSRHHYQA